MLLGVTLVLAGSMAHAAWNVLVKQGAEDGRMFVLAYTLCVLVLTGVGLSVRALLGGAAWEITGTLVLCGFVSAVFHTAYALALQRAYSRADLSLVYPVARGLGPLLAVLFGLLVFGEAFGMLQTLGVVLVLGGMLACTKVGTVGAGAWGRAMAHGAPVGIAIAAYMIWDDYVVAHLDADPVGYYAFTVLFQVMVLAAVCRRSVRTELPRVMRTHASRLWVVGGLVGGSYLAVLFAMQLLPLSVVAPLRATSIVFGTLGAVIWLREERAFQRVVASFSVFAGLGLLVSRS